MRNSDTATILIVDDTKDSADWLERLIRRMMGHQVVVAYSGAQALDMIATHDIDMVVLDWIMPDMDGVETLENIRKTHDMYQLPVIILSANSDSKDISQVFKHGANDYIQKPTPAPIIRARIDNQLDQKRLAKEREEELWAIKRSTTLKTELMMLASHDLKNPLHNLNLILMLLESELEEQAELQSYLKMGQRYISSMVAIIKNFLETDLHDLNGNLLPIDTHPVAIEDIVRTVLEEYAIFARQKSVTLVNEVQPSKVLADPKRLQPAIHNLVSNAIKYTNPNTTVRLIGAPSNGQFVLHVQDEGDGLPVASSDRLFKPFSRLGNAPTNGESSSGLGLWIVKQMMEAQNGEVGYDETYTNGADFFIRLPLAATPDELETNIV